MTARTDAWTILRPGTFTNNLPSWAWRIRSSAPIRLHDLRCGTAVLVLHHR